MRTRPGQRLVQILDRLDEMRLPDDDVHVLGVGARTHVDVDDFLAPDPAQAQSVAKTPQIGILNSAFDPHPPLEAFRQGLRDLGYVEGQNIALEYRFADGRFERLPELAANSHRSRSM